ncbi:hypothetical protein VD0004_g3519, partial [Verticillium dahliae]
MASGTPNNVLPDPTADLHWGAFRGGELDRNTPPPPPPPPLTPLAPPLSARYSPPTNEVNDFLAGVARRTGKLKAGGVPNVEAAADWAVKQWRAGQLG